MRRALVNMAEGRPIGILRWYVVGHLRKCRQCTATYRALLEWRSRVSTTGVLPQLVLSDERWKEIERACQDESSS